MLLVSTSVKTRAEDLDLRLYPCGGHQHPCSSTRLSDVLHTAALGSAQRVKPHAALAPGSQMTSQRHLVQDPGCFEHYSSLSGSTGHGSRTLTDTQILGAQVPHMKEYLNETYIQSLSHSRLIIMPRTMLLQYKEFYFVLFGGLQREKSEHISLK